MPVGARLLRQVRDRAGDACEYCRTPQELSPTTLEIDHALPKSQSGKTELANLCLACRTCNGAKQARTEVRRGKSRRAVPLFNPRLHAWDEHFRWNGDFSQILGLTPTGRATIEALDMNSERMVTLRKLWVMMKVFPDDR